MYPNNNMYNGFMPRQSYPSNGYPQGYGGAYPPYMAAQAGQTMQPQEPPLSDLRFLTEDEIKAFIVMPNTKVLLIDKDRGVACIKSANAAGESFSKLYSFSPIDGAKKEPPKQESEPAVSYDKEIKDLIARVEKWENGRIGKSKNAAEN